MSLLARLEHLHRLKHQRQVPARPLRLRATLPPNQTTRTANARTPEEATSIGPAVVRMAASRPIIIESLIITAVPAINTTTESAASVRIVMVLQI